MVYPIIYRVLNIPGGARILPSTVCEEGDSSIEVLEDLERDDSERRRVCIRLWGLLGSWFPGQKKTRTNAKGDGGLPSK